MSKNNVSCNIDVLLGVSGKKVPKLGCSLCDEWDEARVSASNLLREHRETTYIAGEILRSWWRQGMNKITLPKSVELKRSEARLKQAEKAHLRCDRCTILIGPKHHERKAHYIGERCLCDHCALEQEVRRDDDLQERARTQGVPA
ncbi:MAG: hypothetical protein JRD89_02930 [Deltaproteobacteria bacterium]|nr:hypothetical protein [Deltaproteobacteria bacterium]